MDELGASGKHVDPSFNFFGLNERQREGSFAFSDISFPSHVSELESFHSELDISLNSRDSIATRPSEDFYPQADSECTLLYLSKQHGGVDKTNISSLPDLPEQASENIDMVLAALKAATVQGNGSDGSNENSKSETSISSSNLDSSRFISKEDFPESVLAESSESWEKEAMLSSGEIANKPSSIPSCEDHVTTTTTVKSDKSNLRLSEKLFPPSKKSIDQQSWSEDTSLNPEELTIQPSSTPFCEGGVGTVPDSRLSEKFFAPSKTPEDHDDVRAERTGSNPWSFSGSSTLFQTPAPEGNTFNQATETEQSSKPNSTLKTITEQPSFSAPIQKKLSWSDNKSFQDKDSIGRFDNSKTAEQKIFNPFDDSDSGPFTSSNDLLDDERNSFQDDGFSFNQEIQDDFSFQSADAAAQRLDKDEEIFKTNHMFDKEDAMVADNTTMFSDYVLPTDISKGGRRSLLVTGVNDPDEKGEVRISFGNFFAAKTEELGRLGDGDENRPRPQFSATRLEVSPTANTPRPLYRPSSPEGSEEEAVSRQTSSNLKVVQAKQTKTVQNVKLQEEKKAVVDMTTRSLPYGAEDKDKEKVKEKKIEQTRHKNGNKSRTSNIDPNSSALAALQFCQSSQGSKVLGMSLDEVKSLSSNLAKVTQGDSREIYQVIVNFIYKEKNLSQTTSDVNDELSQRLTDVFYTEKNRPNGGESTIGGKQASEEPDGLTFYHSDTSCDVCPTESRFETSLATVTSPPLDTSSPKSTGSSIAVQTDSNDINQTFPIPSHQTAATTVTTTASLTTLMTEAVEQHHSSAHTVQVPEGFAKVGLNTGSSLSGISVSTTRPNLVPTTDQTSVTARNISASAVITPDQSRPTTLAGRGRTTYPTTAAGTTYPSSAVGAPYPASTGRITYPPPTVIPTYLTPTVRAAYPSSAVRATYPVPTAGAAYPAVAERFPTPSGGLTLPNPLHSRPGVAQLASKGRTVSSAMFNNRALVSNKTLQPHPRSAFHPQAFFNSQASESRVGDVIDPSLTHEQVAQFGRTHVWTGASEVFHPVKQLGHRQQEVWNWRTERTSQIQMVIPPVLDFSEVLCVGMSAQAHLAIYNPTSRWIRCSSLIISCTVNGVKVDHQSDCPFSIQETTLVGPKLTEKVKVHFECLAAGVYVAEMKVVSTPVGSLASDNESSSALVTVQGLAEQPKLEILADELDFGELHHGCNALRPLGLVNKGMTAIPLKMMICSNDPGMFVFSKNNSPDEIEKLEIQNTALKCLLPAINDLGNQPEPLTIWIELVGKNHHCFEKSDEAVLFTAGINIQLDTGTVANILGNIQLRGVIGFTKIQIPKAFQMAMCLSSPVGQRVSRQLPFSNAGNICADVELIIPKYSDAFAAVPNKFQVRPGMAVMVEVSFSPRVKDSYESVIQVLETDDSKCYEVLLRGSSVEPKQVTEDGPPILSNKSWLCWTGVDVGKAEHKRLFLLNDSSEQSIHFQAVVLGQHSDFEIQRTKSDFTSGGTSSEQMLLRPKERMPIYVLFAPSSLGVFKSALVLKPDSGPRFQIPFYAYGGTSNLSICDINKTTDSYVADLGQVSLGHRNILRITVKNSGRRAAFVKAVCYADFQIHLHYPQTHLSIVPSEFILPERSSKELVIVYQPLQHDAKACQSQTKRVATVVFYYGDEVIRQWYRRNLTKQQDFDGSKRFDNIRFDKVFQDENCVAEGFDFPDLENWDEVFDNHLSQMLLNLHGGPEKLPASPPVSPDEESSLVMATPARPRSMNEPRALIRSQTPAQKESALKEKTDNYRDAVWSLVPEQLILKVPVKGSGNSTKKVQLLNFSDRPLEFEFIWPAHCIAVTPHRGTIPPKNQVLIRVGVWPSISSSGIHIPWSGTAYVNCDGVKKTLAFQINNHLVSGGSPAPAMTNKPAEAITDPDKDQSGLYQTYSKLQKQNQPLQITPKAIQFAETQVGNILSSFVTLENISMSSLRWQVSSVAPAYAKVSETSSEILRATYPVFCFSTYRGLIRAGQIVKIEVTFQTRDAGDYCQMWDFQINPENPLTSTKIQMELSGKAVAQKPFSGLVAEKIKKVRVSDPEEKKEAVVALVTPVQQLPSKQTSEPAKGNTNIYFQSDNIQFPDTEVGKTSVVKIKICNKSSSGHQFKVTAPQAPFSVKCTDIFTKPAHYLKFPVSFAPGDPCRHYEGMVVFENTNSGELLSVRVQGNSLAK